MRAPATVDVLTLIPSSGAAVVVEVSAGRGEFTAQVAQAAPNATVIAIDLWRRSEEIAELQAQGPICGDADAAFVANCRMVANRVVPLRADPRRALLYLADHQVQPDLIFLHARGDAAAEFTELLMASRLWPGASLAGDALQSEAGAGDDPVSAWARSERVEIVRSGRDWRADRRRACQRRFLLVCSDERYYRFMQIAVGSFLAFNPGWGVKVLDVGLNPVQRREIENKAQLCVEPAVQSPGHLSDYPGALARLKALAELRDDELMIYVDCDVITCAPAEQIVGELLQRGCGFAAHQEYDPHVPGGRYCPINQSWAGGVPLEAFPGGKRWEDRGQLTTGALLAAGRRARAIGLRCLELYPSLSHRLGHGEQTMFSSVMMETGEPYLPLGYWQVCQCEEEHLDGADDAERYIRGEPCVDGRRILFRHFLRTNIPVITALHDRLAARFPW